MNGLRNWIDREATQIAIGWILIGTGVLLLAWSVGGLAACSGC